MKLLDAFIIIALVSFLVVGLTPYVQAKIVSSGTATTGSGTTGTVTSITEGTGLSFSVNPLIATGTINLAEALIGTIGGVKTGDNCSNGYFFAGYNATNIPNCVGERNNGTLISVTCDEVGVTCNPTEIVSTGMVLLKNATTTTIGGVRVLNCSGNGHVSGYDDSMNPFCSANNGNGTVTSITVGTGLSGGTITTSGTIALNDANPKQPYFGFSDKIFAWLRPNGTTATVFGGTGWSAFTMNGTVTTHALNQGYYIKFASSATINSSAGIAQTAIQTQGRYLPIIRTSIMTNTTNANIREYFGITNNPSTVYFTARGGNIEYKIEFDRNASQTAWNCCSNDGAALGHTCTAIAIDHTTATPYNLTLNLSNIPTDFTCTVQNATATASVTKSSNIPSAANNALDLGVQNIAIAQTASAVTYAIRYMYLETK